MDNAGLVATMIGAGRLASDHIIHAFLTVDRIAFVPAAQRDLSYEDRPLPLMPGATISQPSTVAIMLELLQPREGDSVLDVGSGSGWTTALLAACVGPKGNVIGTERIPALVVAGQEKLAERGLENAAIVQAGPQPGQPGRHFDRILVSACAEAVPDTLFDQLAPEGIMVIPVSTSLHKLVRMSDRIDTSVYPGFVFVPLR